MSKINVFFENENYTVDEESFSSAVDAIRAHLLSAMNGTGATINFGGTSYNVDSTKLSSATNDFVTHLGTISGSGHKVVVNGTEYAINSSDVVGAIENLQAILGGTYVGGSGSGDDGSDEEEPGGIIFEQLAPGLYETGSNYTVLLKDWDTLVSENTITADGEVVWNNRDNLAGDLVFDESTTVKSLTRYAGTHKLTGVVIPGSIGALDSKTIYNCQGLTSVVLCDGITEIGQNSFSGTANGNIVYVQIPDTVLEIGEWTFQSCDTSVFTQYGNCYYLGNKTNPYVALWKYIDKDSTSFEIHPDCKCIAGDAFYQCENFEHIEIPNNVVTICTNAFYFCKMMNSVTIPSSVTKIQYHAFDYCTSLTSITFNGTVEQWNAVTKGNEWNRNVPATEVVCTDGTVAL